MKKLISLLLALVMVCSMVSPALAASDEATSAANALYELGLFSGTGTDASGKPNFDLDRTPTRQEAIVMLVRLLGKEQEAKAGTWEMPFTDVDAWAKPYVGYAFANGLATGTSATTFGGSDLVNATQYLTFVLRALGYASGTDFQWDKAWELSDKLEITHGQYSKSENFYRNDIAVISLSTLNGKLNDGSSTLAELLIKNGVFTQEVYQKPAPTVDVWDGTVATSFAGGNGTEESPYLISTGAQLAYLAQVANDRKEFYDTYFKLIKDIDLNNIDWKPIGNTELGFNGIFNGNGHNVVGLSINHIINSVSQIPNTDENASFWGLFGNLGTRATAKNIFVSGNINVEQNLDVLRDRLNVGGVAGACSGKVINCHFTGAVSANTRNNKADGHNWAYVGGIVGCFGGNNEYSNLSHCSNQGSITAMGTGSNVAVGGVAGGFRAEYGVIQNCWNSGTIICDGQKSNTNGLGSVSSGGIIGDVFNGTVENCYNTGTLSYKSPSTAKHNIIRIGGIIGKNDTRQSEGTSNCYNNGSIEYSGSINPNCAVGKIVGMNQRASLTNCYWSNINSKVVPMGQNDGSLVSLGFFSSSTSALSSSLDTILLYPGTLLDALNNWVTSANNNGGNYSHWEIVKDKNNGYPILKLQQ